MGPEVLNTVCQQEYYQDSYYAAVAGPTANMPNFVDTSRDGSL